MVIKQHSALKFQNIVKMDKKIPKFIYIDDEEPQIVESFIHGLNDTGKIKVVRLDFSESKSMELLCGLIKTQDCDGLLMDLRLDGEGVNRLGISATPIAQQIRTLAAQKEIPEYPIVLCSTLKKLKATYEADLTSHDLFDCIFTKTEYDRDKAATKMSALANGYNLVQSSNGDLFKLLDRQLPDKIDNRIFERFISNKHFGGFEFLSYIINEIFHHSGILVKENVLAARLGVDIDASGNAWKEVLARLSDIGAVYSGVLSDGWKRYWADVINDFFEKVSDGELLPILTAKERVDILETKLNIKGLKAADTLKYCTSSMFWSVCEGYKKPLDPAEGYEVFESDVLKSWQESKYMSFAAVVSEKFPKIRLTTEAQARFHRNKIELREKSKK